MHPRDKLTQAVLRKLMSEMDEPNANYAAELEYCDDMILEAARELIAHAE